MYNSFTKGTEAWFAAKEAIDAVQVLEDAVGTAESTFENILGQLDDAVDHADEMEQERDDFEEKYEEAVKKLAAIDLDKDQLIKDLTQIKVAAESMAAYSTKKLVELGALNENADSDGSSGTDGDGSGQDIDPEGSGKAAT